MALVILRDRPRGDLSPAAQLSWGLDALEAIVRYLRDLVHLDLQVRKTRSENAETAQQFIFQVVAGAVIRIADLVPNVKSEVYTTLLLGFDAASGAARWRIDGGDPLTATLTPNAGFPLPAGATSITIVGWQNIKNFAIVAEAAGTPANLSGFLFK